MEIPKHSYPSKAQALEAIEKAFKDGKTEALLYSHMLEACTYNGWVIPPVSRCLDLAMNHRAPHQEQEAELIQEGQLLPGEVETIRTIANGLQLLLFLAVARDMKERGDLV